MIKRILFSLVAIVMISLCACQSGTQSDVAMPTATGTSNPTVIPTETGALIPTIAQIETGSSTPKAAPPTPTAPADITPTPTVSATVTPTPAPDALIVTVIPKGEITLQVSADETVVLAFDEQGRLKSICKGTAGNYRESVWYRYRDDSSEYSLDYFYAYPKYMTVFERSEYADGTPEMEVLSGRKGGFGYFEMISENANGTVTLQYKTIADDWMVKTKYYENGVMSSKEECLYETLGVNEFPDFEDVPLIKKYTTYTTEGVLYGYGEEESGNAVKVVIYDENEEVAYWTSYEYHANGELKTKAIYLGEGTGKPSDIRKFTENAEREETILWEYNEDGSYIKRWIDVNSYGLNPSIELGSTVLKAIYCNADDTVISWEETEYDEEYYAIKHSSYLGEGTSKPQTTTEYNKGTVCGRELYQYDEDGELLSYIVISYDEYGNVADIEVTEYGQGEEPAPENPGEDDEETGGSLKSTSEKLYEKVTETEVVLNQFWSGLAPFSQFVTPDGYGVAYHGEYMVTIYLYNKQLELYDTIILPKEYEELGAITCDEDGNFYAVYGKTNTSGSLYTTVISIVKYSSDGKRLASVNYQGSETANNQSNCAGSETRRPFYLGNCSVAVKNGLLVCTYSRMMMNGRQANMVHYVETDTMTKADIVPYYNENSLDNQVIATKDGGFLFVDHGDGYGRAFVVNKLVDNKSSWNMEEAEVFHFREGSDRETGFNETYAQLGGIAELPNSYILVGASERTLSLETAPTNRNYCGYSEPRDLFIQYLKKDFYHYNEVVKNDIILRAGGFAVAGETRTAVGTKPTDALTDLFLTENTEDYGVIWLTDYTGDELVYNPKVVTTETGEVIILWQKVSFETNEILDTYYMMLDAYGEVLCEPVSLGVVPLSTNEPVVYADGSVYWSVCENNGLTSYRFAVPTEETDDFREDVRWRVFDAEYYLEQHPELATTVGTDAEALYSYWLEKGIALGHAASPVFVPMEYMWINQEIASNMNYDYSDIAWYFFDKGIYEGQRGSCEFDYTVYKEYNSDLWETLGDDVISYYEHYVTCGRAEGRTASLEDGTEALTNEFVLVPEGTQKFITRDLIQVEVDFDAEGSMKAQRFYSMGNKLLDELECGKFKYDPIYYINRIHNNVRTRVVEWKYSDEGVLWYKEVDASKKELYFVEIVSENTDGTVTVRLEHLPKGNYYMESYDNGVPASLEEKKYNEAGECIEMRFYESNEEGAYIISWVRGYENGKLISDTFYYGGIISEHSEFVYDAEGHLRDGAWYYYTRGELDYYTISTYSYNPLCIFGSDLCLTYKKYNADNTLTEEARYDYYEDGIQKETETKYYNNGVVSRHALYRYDTMGREIYSLIYSKGKFSEHKEYEYHENGELKKEISYYDETTDNPKSVKEYDEDGNRITS